MTQTHYILLAKNDNIDFFRLPEIRDLVQENKFLYYIEGLKNKQVKFVEFVFNEIDSEDKFQILDNPQEESFITFVTEELRNNNSEFIVTLINKNILPHNRELTDKLFELFYELNSEELVMKLCQMPKKPSQPTFLCKYLDNNHLELFKFISETYGHSDENELVDLCANAAELNLVKYVEYINGNYLPFSRSIYDDLFERTCESGAVQTAQYLASKCDYYYLDCTTNEILSYKIWTQQEKKVADDLKFIKNDVESLKLKMSEYNKSVENLVYYNKQSEFMDHEENLRKITQEDICDVRNLVNHKVSDINNKLSTFQNLTYDTNTILSKLQDLTDKNSINIETHRKSFAELFNLVDKLESRVMKLTDDSKERNNEIKNLNDTLKSQILLKNNEIDMLNSRMDSHIQECDQKLNILDLLARKFNLVQ